MYHPGQIEENEIFWNGLSKGWERKSLQLWQLLSKDSNTILDIGANTGIYGLVAQALNPSAKVFCFEPLPAVYNLLVKNIHKNSFLIRSEMLALSNYSGSAKIYLNKGESFAYSVTVNKNTLNHNNFDELEIQTSTLSEYIFKHKINHIDLMKIDVEGHEIEVLEGMKDFLTSFKPTILIEVLTKEIGHELTKVFENMDYLYFNIDDENNSIRRTETIEKSDFWNYLICNELTAQKLGLI